ncbi:MAG: hypothetical protein EXR51_09105 [Dehalococcoidia bacterium]|nr:hypothetical protein [Dehalococcoidia bacterium]
MSEPGEPSASIGGRQADADIETEAALLQRKERMLKALRAAQELKEELRRKYGEFEIEDDLAALRMERPDQIG